MVYRYILIFATVLLVACASEETPEVSMTESNHTSSVVPPVVPVVEDKESDASAIAEYETLEGEYQAAVKALREKIASTDSKDKQAEMLATENPVEKYAPQFMALARKFQGTKASLNATLFVVGQSKGERKNEAMTFLLENYSDKVKLTRIADSLLKEVPSPELESWFGLMIDKSTSAPVKANVMLVYAKYLGQLPFFKRTIEMNPQVAAKLPESQLDYINRPRTDEQRSELAAILQSLIDDYGGVKYRGRQTYADVAKSELFELEHLRVGQVVPEIEGKDLDGIEFKLSDYRGKIVMLDFWGHWCPACRAMYDHDQDIVREMAGKPFVLIGVNSDADKDVAIGAVQSESLSWRHFWNGSTGTRGPISTQWNVDAWPTVYLICLLYTSPSPRDS